MITFSSSLVTRHSSLSDDLLGQLLGRAGRMAELGCEGGDPKLDWVDGVEIALQHPEWLEACEREAWEILRSGIRHIIWAGMGGSVQTVYVLKRMGLLDTDHLHVYPCDGTDPAGLNRILREIAVHDGLPDSDAAIVPNLRALLSSTMMIGVSMGMTSEEPITHLRWFDGLLLDERIPDPGDHIQVMTLPGSFLDQFARPRGCKMFPIQLDGQNHTPGRMSAPATRVFVRPVCLRLMADRLAEDPEFQPDGSGLRTVLEGVQSLYGVSAQSSTEQRRKLQGTNGFVELGACIAERASQGLNQVALVTSPEWEGFAPWLEQLVEESLGKGGEGFLLFYGNQDWSSVETDPLRLGIDADAEVRLNIHSSQNPTQRLIAIGGLFAGFKLTVAVFGYLHDIVFAGQPAVESYKAYARQFRDAEAEDVPIPKVAATWNALSLHSASLEAIGAVSDAQCSEECRPVGDAEPDAAGWLAAIIRLLSSDAARRPLRYLDFTWNGEITGEIRRVLEHVRLRLANQTLGIPAKIRTGPSDYHSTEQSEVDGPDELLSIRFVASKHDSILAGEYSAKFLLAQARGTWQAMEDAGRRVVMITMPEVNANTGTELARFFGEVIRGLKVDI